MADNANPDDALCEALAAHHDDFVEALDSLWDVRPNHFTPTRVTYSREGDEIVDIDFKWMRLTDDALPHLQHLVSLKRLSIRGAEITDEGLEALLPLQDLEELNLGRTPITDAGLGALKEFPQLRLLDVSATSVTDDGMHHLGWIEALEGLYLDFCRDVGDAGLEPLADLQQLKLLHVHCTLVSENGMDRFLKRLPDCEVIA